jgi:hypothetical protein
VNRGILPGPYTLVAPEHYSELTAVSSKLDFNLVNFNVHHNTMVSNGLQPVNLLLAIFPSVVCVALVSIRIWMRTKQRLLGIGKDRKCPVSHNEADSILSQKMFS